MAEIVLEEFSKELKSIKVALNFFSYFIQGRDFSSVAYLTVANLT